MRKVFFVLILLTLVSCQTDSKTARTLNMYNDSGDMIGTAKLSESPDGVNVKLTLEGLDPGYHGIHVHEYPKCDGPDFKSAGSHFNPEGKKHGLMNPEGPHLGDLPNIEADEDGLVSNAELMLSDATMLKGKKSIVFNGDGTSLVIQKDKDDGYSQPGGDAGPRVACGTIKSETSDQQPPSDPTDLNDKQQE